MVYRTYPAANLTDTGQTLVEGTTITLSPLVADYSASGSDTVSLEFSPSGTGVGTTDSAPMTLTVPTGLDASTWETLLEEELQTNGGQVTDVRDVPAGVEIDLAAAEYTVLCPVVGVGSTPETNPSEVLGSGSGGDINPADGGAVRLVDADRDSADADRLVLTFENRGDTVNLSDARISFYFEDNGDGPSTVDLLNYSTGTTLVDDLARGGAAKEPPTRQAFAGSNNSTTLRVDLDDGSFKPKDGDFLVLQFAFDDGEQSTYFVDVPPQSDVFGGGGGTPTPTPAPASTPTPTPGGGPGPPCGSPPCGGGGPLSLGRYPHTDARVAVGATQSR